MSTPLANKSWDADADAEEKRWRKSIEESRPAMEQLQPKDGKPASSFYVLCLAELDAARHFARSDCFVSRETLVGELRRLMVEPTLPSQPVPDVGAYHGAQKWWLEFVIKQYEEASEYEDRLQRP
jgi:hypothetical protein